MQKEGSPLNEQQQLEFIERVNKGDFDVHLAFSVEKAVNSISNQLQGVPDEPVELEEQSQADKPRKRRTRSAPTTEKSLTKGQEFTKKMRKSKSKKGDSLSSSLCKQNIKDVKIFVANSHVIN